MNGSLMMSKRQCRVAVMYISHHYASSILEARAERWFASLVVNVNQAVDP
jgi:hypothetical protein